MFLTRVWQSFIGVEHDVAQEKLKKALQKLEVDYELTRGNGSYLFDPKKQSYNFYIKQYDLRVILYSATGDPLQRFLFQFIGRHKELNGISVIKVFPIKEKNKSFVLNLLRVFGRILGEKLLQLDKHPRFQTAFLLKYKVHRQWKKVLNTH